MADSQTIEARLCAYIDGDLNEADRIAIELHLDVHPQHRRMIRDLIVARRLVAALPHVPAPVDLGETLQGQIERSILLAENPEHVNRWHSHIRLAPQRAALAAALVLAIGLSAVIFQLLRAASRPEAVGALMPPPAAATQPAPAERVAIAAPVTQPVEVGPIAAGPTTEPADATMADAGEVYANLEEAVQLELTDTDQAATQPTAEDAPPLPALPALPASDTAPPQNAPPATQPVADNGGDQ